VAAAPRFLTAEWRNLLMLNYAIDPSALARHVPWGCELDAWEGRTLVSVVGFQFLRTRVGGIPIPGNTDFEEVNLRFYVRRKAHGEWRRGVVFIKELVPRPAIAWVARRIYGENYVALPMRHALDGRVAYGWRRLGRWEGLSATIAGTPTLPADDGEETFITDHAWGYTRRGERRTDEYEVEHPRWRVWNASNATLDCDAASLYGAEFAGALSQAPGVYPMGSVVAPSAMFASPLLAAVLTR
jgi:uncharacterized protein YqjF (DUF2071 family)